MKGFVYILQSLKNGQYYIGSTKNIDKRLLKHNLGYVKATRNFRPYILKLSQEYKTITDARNIEYRIKNLKRRDYIKKIIDDGYIKITRVRSSRVEQ